MSKEWEISKLPPPIEIDGASVSPLPAEALYQMAQGEQFSSNNRLFELYDRIAGNKFGDSLRLVNTVLRSVAEREGLPEDVPFKQGGAYEKVGGTFDLRRMDGPIYSEVTVFVTKLPERRHVNTNEEEQQFKQDGRFVVGGAIYVTHTRTGEQVSMTNRWPLTEDMDKLGVDEARRGRFESWVTQHFAEDLSTAKNGQEIIESRRKGKKGKGKKGI